MEERDIRRHAPRPRDVPRLRGLLRPEASEQRFRLERLAPADDLADLVLHHWIVEWDFPPGESFLSQTLPHASCHLTIEPDGSRFTGVLTGDFTYRQEGAGRVVGLRFRPGTTAGWVGFEAWRLTDQQLPIDAVVPGVDVAALEATVRDAADDEAAVTAIEEALRPVQPTIDPRVEVVDRVIEQLVPDPDVHTVEDLAAGVSTSVRTLQRLFRSLVGVSPKWVLMRHRLHSATSRVAPDADIDWAALATDLGYYDQAHFIHEFRRVVGLTPAAYAREVADTTR